MNYHLTDLGLLVPETLDDGRWTMTSGGVLVLKKTAAEVEADRERKKREAFASGSTVTFQDGTIVPVKSWDITTCTKPQVNGPKYDKAWIDELLGLVSVFDDSIAKFPAKGKINAGDMLCMKTDGTVGKAEPLETYDDFVDCFAFGLKAILGDPISPPPWPPTPADVLPPVVARRSIDDALHLAGLAFQLSIDRLAQHHRLGDWKFVRGKEKV